MCRKRPPSWPLERMATSSGPAGGRARRRWWARRRRGTCVGPFPPLLGCMMCASPRCTCSWWDEGHMVTAAIAANHVRNRPLFDALLSCEPRFANFSSMATAAAWPDHIKCTERDLREGVAYCQGLARSLGLLLFFPLHLSKNAYKDPNYNVGDDPKGARIADSYGLPPDKGRPTGITGLWDIRKSRFTFGVTCTSPSTRQTCSRNASRQVTRVATSFPSRLWMAE